MFSATAKRDRSQRGVMNRTAFAAIFLSFALAASAVSGTAYAGVDKGTGGSGYTVFPSSSPYISYAYVTACHSEGSPVLFYQGKVTLGTTEATGPKQAWPGPESTVNLRRNGSYTGTWRCMAK